MTKRQRHSNGQWRPLTRRLTMAQQVVRRERIAWRKDGRPALERWRQMQEAARP